MDHSLPHIALCGAGISGLTLAGILSNSIGATTKITVFERASETQDQGYGLDLDEHGQEALVRAGVYEKYWDVSRHRSDSMALYPPQGDDAIMIMFRPTTLQGWFPSYFAARPETSRSGMRDLLLEAIKERPNVELRYETGVYDIKAHGEKQAELIGADDVSLGVFDLVVDGTGVHSRLRNHRVNDPEGKILTGELAIHGVIEDPETNPNFGEDLLKRFGTHGSLMVIAQGYELFIQRFGGGTEDNRTAFFYIVKSDEEKMFEELGFDKPASRQDGIMEDEHRLGKVKEWILNDMGEVFDPMYKDAVRSLNRVSVRSWETHGPTDLKGDVSLPLVCIGDSQRNTGLGAGGILAMHDCLDLSELLKKPEIFGEGGVADWAPIRKMEQVFLERKNETNDEMMPMRLKLIDRRENGDVSLHWDFMFESWWARTLASWTLPTLVGWWIGWYFSEAAAGTSGSHAESPIYPSVKGVWDEMKEKNSASYTREGETRGFLAKFL